MDQNERKLALITGASSGIGKDLARLHAENGGDVILVARSQDKLNELKSDLENKHQIKATVIAKDLSLPDAADELFDEVQSQDLKIDYLINNAGFGGHGFFHEREWDKDKTMIQLNVMALTALTRKFLPGMIERGNGRILNVSSMAAFLPGPLQAVYYATKAYVLSFSEALANELSGTGVTVTALCPGATKTEFARVAEAKNTRAFKMHKASSESVAAYGYKAMLKGKIVAVPGMQNKFAVHFLLRFMPRAMQRWASRKSMENV